MHTFAPYIASLLSLATWTLADEGYASNCNSVQLFQPGFAKNGPPNNVYIDANCQTAPGQIYNVDTGININECFTNINGQIQGQYGGGFGSSCRNLYLDGTVMHAQCQDDSQNYVDTSIDTWYYIGNDGGRLTCFGQKPT